VAFALLGKGYGVTLVPGILCLMKSAAHCALAFPTSLGLEKRNRTHSCKVDF